MKILLPLSKGLFASIDQSDKHLAEHKWSAMRGVNTHYAMRWIGGNKFILLHRAVLGYTGNDDVDHIDGDGLNCSKDNLRIVSRTVNNLNRVRHSQSNVKVRYLADGSKRYDARIGYNNASIHLGTTRSLWTAQRLVMINVQRAIAGERLIAIKRAHRFALLEKWFVT